MSWPAVYVYQRSRLRVGRRTLYVGRDKRFPDRCGAHRRNNEPWHKHCSRVKVIRCRSHAEAAQLETVLIWALRPEFNLQGSPRRRAAQRSRRAGRPLPTSTSFVVGAVGLLAAYYLVWLIVLA